MSSEIHALQKKMVKNKASYDIVDFYENAYEKNINDV
jgi:hypothetical protein